MSDTQVYANFWLLIGGGLLAVSVFSMAIVNVEFHISYILNFYTLFVGTLLVYGLLFVEWADRNDIDVDPGEPNR